VGGAGFSTSEKMRSFFIEGSENPPPPMGNLEVASGSSPSPGTDALVTRLSHALSPVRQLLLPPFPPVDAPSFVSFFFFPF